MNIRGFKYDDFEYDKKTDIIYNKTTGEIFEANEDNVKLLVELKQKEDRVRKARELEMKRSAGIGGLADEYNREWMKEHHFIQTYRVINEKISRELDISKDEAMLLYIFESRIEFKTNRVTLHNGEGITNNDIRELANMGRDKVEKTLKSLEDKRFIKRVGHTSAREIYYNPYLKSAGNVMSKEVIKLFEKLPLDGQCELD